MKKLSIKKRSKKAPSKQQIPSRITNETVAEHRERILAGGRRFKYPIQYSRHKLVINTIVIGVVTIIFLSALLWWLLYYAQNTSDILYRVTKVIPVPVASIDGKSVRYSDYLSYYRSSMHYIISKEQQEFDAGGLKNQQDIIKSRSYDLAIRDSYAQKLASEMNITVSDDELDKFVDLQRKTSGSSVSDKTYDSVIMDYYGWSPEEYRHVLKDQLLRKKVEFAIDDTAMKLRDQVQDAINKSKDPNFDKIAKSIKDIDGVKVVSSTSGLVPKYNQKDGGLSQAADALEKGDVSDAIKSTNGDGYYFVMLTDKKKDQLSYDYIKIPLTEFEKHLSQLKDQGKIKSYIEIPDSTPRNN